ncbi:MAG TPA: hypothetical protein VFT55_07760 [Planctomycetota bacterium]|nr:hypothetical protein [Planctomycetota bacterium]
MLAALLVAVVLPAQAADAPASRLFEFDKLVAEWTAAMQARRDESRPLDSLAFGTRAIELADQYGGATTRA